MSEFSVRVERPDLITSTEAARVLGCPVPYLRRLVDEGVLSERRVGKSWPRYFRPEVEALAETSTRRRREAVGC